MNMNEPKELALDVHDYVTSATKAVAGIFPFVGSLLVEIAGTVIPNQRIDRIAKFATTLKTRLTELEHDFVRSQLTNENFTDLVEEGLRQAARSLSDERREYIASLVTNSLKAEDIEFIESKYLLRILGELNDIEVLWLRFYLDATNEGDDEFWEKHQGILQPVGAHMGSTRHILDKAILQESYKEHLAGFGLLERNYQMDMSSSRTKMKVSEYTLSPLGRLLLRQIGLSLTDED